MVGRLAPNHTARIWSIADNAAVSITVVYSLCPFMISSRFGLVYLGFVACYEFPHMVILKPLLSRKVCYLIEKFDVDQPSGGTFLDALTLHPILALSDNVHRLPCLVMVLSYHNVHVSTHVNIASLPLSSCRRLSWSRNQGIRHQPSLFFKFSLYYIYLTQPFMQSDDKLTHVVLDLI